MPLIARRNFLIGLGAGLVAAPAIVRAANLMPVRGVVVRPGFTVCTPSEVEEFNRVMAAYRGEFIAQFELRNAEFRRIIWATPDVASAA